MQSKWCIRHLASNLFKRFHSQDIMKTLRHWVCRTKGGSSTLSGETSNTEPRGIQRNPLNMARGISPSKDVIELSRSVYCLASACSCMHQGTNTSWVYTETGRRCKQSLCIVVYVYVCWIVKRSHLASSLIAYYLEHTCMCMPHYPCMD